MIAPQPSSYADFPASTISISGMQTIPADDRLRSCQMHLNVEYARKSGVPLHLQIIEPRQIEGQPEELFPIIVYVQGSAWFQQNLGFELAQLSRMAQRGFLIAVVEYRPSPLAPFPAQIQDTKTALRFMRQQAASYHGDPERLIVWGDSSGGHTAAMTGVSLDVAELDDQSPDASPIALRAVVDYYGPTDISRMNDEPSTFEHYGPASPEGMLIGGLPVLEHPEKVAPTVPMNYLTSGKRVPPFLIFHGDKDRLVPFGQSVLLFSALQQSGNEAEFYKIQGADHGGAPFWSAQVLDMVEAFLRRSL